MSDKEKMAYMKDEPLARMGELWAKLYYHCAKEILSLGEEGEKPFVELSETMRQMGVKQRGSKLRR